MPKAALSFAAVFGATGAAAITEFCRYSCAGGTFSDFCYPDQCQPPPTGCSLFAYQPFHDDVVCDGFLKSKPACNGATMLCPEAADYQLVYDRGCDLQRTFEAGDFPGVARTWNDTGVLFVAGGTAFIMGRDDIAIAVEAFHKKGVVNVSDTVNYILAVGGNDTNPDFVHSVGKWSVEKDGAESQAADWYALWAQKNDTHWVMDVLVATPTAASAAGLAAPPSAGAAQDPALFKEISDRQAEFSKMYNEGNYNALVAEFFTDESAIIPSTDRRPVNKEGAASFFNGLPLTKQAKTYPTIVTMSLDGGKVHEIGFSDSTSTGYYARWVRKSEQDKWLMEVQCLGVFPKAFQQTKLVV